MTEKEKSGAVSANERKETERTYKRGVGLVRRDVWAHKDDWDYIREIESELIAKRGIKLKR